MAKNNQRDPSLRTTTVARVNQLLNGGLTKAGAFEKISAETGRAKDAVQMLYYRAIRAAKAGPKSGSKPAVKSAPSSKAATSPAVAKPAVVATPAPAPKPASRSRRRSRKASRRAARPRPQSVAQSGDFPALLNGIAAAINALLKHVEKTVHENKTLKEQSARLKAITSLIRGR
ncbi:MAG: hypothetical protein JJE39_15810 [Vicinamibacteria bacterium]|nr:hypothetical protein [Vicinamibacteria bacterium]